MIKQIVIYLPRFSQITYEQLEEIKRRYPGCSFAEVYQDGAIMWQKALGI